MSQIVNAVDNRDFAFITLNGKILTVYQENAAEAAAVTACDIGTVQQLPD